MPTSWNWWITISRGGRLVAASMATAVLSGELRTGGQGAPGSQEAGGSHMNETLANIHPGEILLEEFLKPLQMTPYRLAVSLDVPQTRVAEILKGKRAITSDTALRLARLFGTSDRFWLNLQASYDLEETKRSLGDQLDKIKPIAAAAA